jgi:hypothetical protein
VKVTAYRHDYSQHVWLVIGKETCFRDNLLSYKYNFSAASATERTASFRRNPEPEKRVRFKDCLVALFIRQILSGYGGCSSLRNWFEYIKKKQVNINYY